MNLASSPKSTASTTNACGSTEMLTFGGILPTCLIISPSQLSSRTRSVAFVPSLCFGEQCNLGDAINHRFTFVRDSFSSSIQLMFGFINSLPRSSVCMADCRLQLILLTMYGRSTGCRRSHTKDRCVISSGLIRTTAVDGVSLLVMLATYLDKTLQKPLIITTV